MDFQTADLYDAYEDLLQVALPIFKSYGNLSKFHGEIVTVKCFEDNSLVAENLGKNGEGKVLVVHGGGSLKCALVGDNLAKKAIDNGWAGIIVNGCIRDSHIINQMQIGIRALNTNPKKSVKKNAGLLNETVHFAEVTFVPGHFVYADEDGIVISEKPLLRC